ncbi:MAG: transcriptional regulator [Chloroflexaceae bacterium]|nr:transcriptional regulator [Chloroflexaceae bacterium]NJL32691.1 transcriptional regulator [Chloroflexaceae bacterium]NJO05138.1 transcriptional regulator [Chloroflexaceae bacterium]
MQPVPLTLVTIIAEHVLKEKLLFELRQIGVSGYTTSEVEGRGSRGVRASEWQGSNVKIETLVSVEKSERILEMVSREYFAHYAVIVYRVPVEALRAEKFA